MKLNILNRILIFTVLPKEGNILTMKTLKSLKNKVVFSEDEVKEYEIRIEEDNYKWNPEKDKEVDFDITEGEVKIISDGLKELDTQGKITENYLSLCEMFNVE